MGYMWISKPGSDYGPCADECTHEDCKHLRKWAEGICPLCNEPLGYERGFYRKHVTEVLEIMEARGDEKPRVVGRDQNLNVHNTCLQEALGA